MRQKAVAGEKPLIWVGASKRDLLAMPEAVIRHIGGALAALDDYEVRYAQTK